MAIIHFTDFRYYSQTIQTGIEILKSLLGETGGSQLPNHPNWN